VADWQVMREGPVGQDWVTFIGRYGLTPRHQPLLLYPPLPPLPLL
jgi:hypothetical protein